MAYWLFQGNPRYYKVVDGIRDFEQMPWLVTRYAKDMTPGDGVLVWMSGSQGGIVAIAEILKAPELLSDIPDIGYWIDKSRLGTKTSSSNPLYQKTSRQTHAPQ